MKRLVTLARVLAVLSVVVFALGIFGLIYWRWILAATSITAAWTAALETFGSASAIAIFLAVLANYLRVEAGSEH